MNDRHNATPSVGITVADILYAVLRHKWKIAVISGVGLATALALPFVMPRIYESEAKLLLKYVVESRAASRAAGNDSSVSSEEGANIINTEVEILTSLDLAQQVADSVGPGTILAKSRGESNRLAAAEFIHENLTPSVPKGSKVITVRFKHTDPAIAQNVLSQVIEAYLKRHVEIHMHRGEFDGFLTQRMDELRTGLLSTEAELKRAKTNAGIISLEDSRKAYVEQISSVQQKIAEAEAELAERKATVDEIEKQLHPTTAGSNAPAVSTQEIAVSPATTSEYKRVCMTLNKLLKKEQDLLSFLKPESSSVKDIQSRISATEKLKQQLEDAHPGLLGTQTIETRASPTGDPDPNVSLRSTLVSESARAKALQSKITFLTAQLTKIRKEAGNVDQAEDSIAELLRTKKLQEKNYEYFAENLEQSHFDQVLGAGRAYNVSVIQAASPSSLVTDLPRLMAIIGLGSFALGVALALIFEIYLDKSVKRPVDIADRLGLPLFISIPRIASCIPSGSNGKRVPSILTALAPDQKAGERAVGRSTVAPPTAQNVEIAPWDPRHGLRPFCEALRDRLIAIFDVNNMSHKPKLIAVTSCSTGAGVSSVASSLASALSDTGDGNVLLVDMGKKHGTAHQFSRGDLACGVDDLLQSQNRGHALLHENLYLATESTNGDTMPLALPKRFKDLVPKLRASDYDCVVFDMPAVSQVSVTPRLARFMDVIVMVVESEQTNRDVVKQAYALLAQSKTTVGVVLNKRKNYLPRWFQSEF